MLEGAPSLEAGSVRWLRESLDLLHFVFAVMGRLSIVTPLFVYAAAMCAAANFAWCNRQVDIAEHGALLIVGERDVVEVNLAAYSRQPARAAPAAAGSAS